MIYPHTYTYIPTTMASAFNLLTSGGAKFDKNRFKKDIDLFTGVSSSLIQHTFLPLAVMYKV